MTRLDLRIGGATVAVRTCHLDDNRDVEIAAATALLDPEERARAARYVFGRDALRFVRGRAFLRRCLGADLGTDPRRLRLNSPPGVKPWVEFLRHGFQSVPLARSCGPGDDERWKKSASTWN